MWYNLAANLIGPGDSMCWSRSSASGSVGVTSRWASSCCNNSTSSMLTPLQIDRLNFTCWQGGHRSCTTMGTFKQGMPFPAPLPCTTIGVILNPCKARLPLWISVTTMGRHTWSRVWKAVSRAMPETVRFAVTSFRSFGRVFVRHRGCYVRCRFDRCTACRRSCFCCWAWTGTQTGS